MLYLKFIWCSTFLDQRKTFSENYFSKSWSYCCLSRYLVPPWYLILPFIVHCFSFDFRFWICQMKVLKWNVFWNHNFVQNILRKYRKSSKIREDWKSLIFVFAYFFECWYQKCISIHMAMSLFSFRILWIFLFCPKI